MARILNINKYCSEINWEEELKENCINLIVAGTSTGKTKTFLDMSLDEGKNVAFVAPFLSITHQIHSLYPHLDIQTGMKAKEDENSFGGRITTFHSIPRLLELERIDLLVIDEIHSLVNYAGFTWGMLSIFWDTFKKLRIKHPQMKIVALTATPQFLMLYPYFDFNLIVVKTANPLAKPKEILVSRSWLSELKKNDNSFIYLYSSKTQGKQQASKYNGAYIDSATKEKSKVYLDVLSGKASHPRIFTSTLLATGVSIDDFIPTAITNWVGLVDIVQFSARVRPGVDRLLVTQTIPFFAKDGLQRPNLIWSENFETDMKLLNDYQTYYSILAHSANQETLYNLIYQMLYLPEEELPDLEYLVEE